MNNNIRLIGVISPTYTKFDVKNRIIKTLETNFKKNDLEFFNYSNYSALYLKPNYFNDQLHMNEIGAEIFSKNISQKIKYGI